MPSKTDSHRSKTQALRVEGTLNTAPEKVSDPKFLQSDFFDPRDLVQVKYEMLRRVFAENASVTDATASMESRGRRTIRPRRISTRGDRGVGAQEASG